MFNPLVRRILAITTLVAAAASIVLIAIGALPLGIDFQSGTAITYSFDNDPGAAQLRQALNNAGHSEAVIQSFGNGDYFVRVNQLQGGEQNTLINNITSVTGVTPVTLELSSVSSTIAASTVTTSIIAVIVGVVLVMLYIFFAFRSVPRPYRYSLVTAVTLIHDVLITLGIFVVFGWLFGSQINAPFIVAILTVIGYSVNDTIVIFERIRENSQLVPSRSLDKTIVISIKETLTRSLATSFTTLLVVLAMLFIGGATLRDFLLVLATGIVIGTYSSIFVAAPLLSLWDKFGIGGLRRLFPSRSSIGE